MDELAAAIVNLYESVDPYELMDQGGDPIAETMEMLSTDDGMRAVAKWINEIVED